MRFYIAAQLQEAADPYRAGLAATISAIWASFGNQVQLFAASFPVLWLTVFWLLRWVLGASLAIAQRNWDTRKAAHSVGRWILWMVALLIAFCTLGFGFYGCKFVAGAIVGIVLLTEMSGCLKVSAAWAKHLGFKDAERVLGFFSNTMDQRVEDLEDRMSAGEEKSEDNRLRGEDNKLRSESNRAKIAVNSKDIKQDGKITSALFQAVKQDVKDTALLADRVEAIELTANDQSQSQKQTKEEDSQTSQTNEGEY